jgi:imidazolonepropionase-like amidohydrolase
MALIIRNVRLIDCTGAPPVPSATIGVEEGGISWIGPGGSCPRPLSHCLQIDGRGLTLIPGLIDCHEHFTGDGGLDLAERLADDPPEVAAVRASNNARRALFAGVTTARDPGSRGGININIARAVSSGCIVGPRVLAGGEWLAFPGTWGTFARTMHTQEEMLAAVREQMARGAAFIKIGATGIRPDGSTFATLGAEVLSAVVRTAHQAGLKVSAHCVGHEGTRQAAEAGVDSIEHGFYLDEDTAGIMAKKGVYLVPTMSTWDARLRQGRVAGLSKEQLTTTEERRESSIASFKRALAAGVKMAAGSDAGGSPVYHGFLVRELELMVQAGLSPEAALLSATRDAAALLGVQDQVGTIEVGKVADLLLIDGDPLSDITALRNVWSVFQAGRRVK